MATKSLRPGMPAPYSGQARNNTTRTEVTVVRNEPMPPTQKWVGKFEQQDKWKLSLF